MVLVTQYPCTGAVGGKKGVQLELSLQDSTNLRDCITGRADRVDVALQANQALGKALRTPSGNGAGQLVQ